MRFLLLTVVVAVGLLAGCMRVWVDPIQIEPIYIEVTVNHRIQRDLDDFFADLDRQSEVLEYRAVEELLEDDE